MFVNDFEITVEDVKSKLSIIRTDKSGGPDELKPRLLANIHEKIAMPLFTFSKNP